MSSKRQQLRFIIIFVSSVTITLLIMFAGNQIIKYVIRQKMVAGAAASARESDGAENLVIMNGDSGYIGASKVYLTYLDKGYINIKGKNETEQEQWKLLSEFQLDAGTYILTGLSVKNDAVQLRIAEVAGDTVTVLAWQQNDGVVFKLDDKSVVRLHLKVKPGADIDLIARPAIYEEYGNE